MRTRKILIGVGIVASTFHFADNAIELGHYTGPNWITPAGVIAAWSAFTALALAALLRRRPDPVFFACSWLYVAVLWSGLAHYAFGTPMDMPPRSNLTVLLEACAGVALAVALTAPRFRSSRVPGGG
jgi:hypothetical protein